MKVRQDIVVIGAGVVGMATALTLADRGHRVTVLDRAEGAGRGTSFANGAQLSYAYTDALASPSTLAQLPRLLFSLDPAFRLKLRIDPEFFRWCASFLRSSTAACFRRNTLAGLALALRSRRALHRLIERHGIEFAHAVPGKIHLYRNPSSFAAARDMTALKRANGTTQRLLSPQEAVSVEPMLAAVADRIAGAVYTPDEEVGDPYRFCTGATTALMNGGSGTVLFGTTAKRIELEASRPVVVTQDGSRLAGDHLILCAGSESAALARGVGSRLPILPMKGYSITARLGTAAPSACVTDVANRVVFARLGNRMRIAGLADLGNGDTRIDPRRLETLIASARAALPDAADYDMIESSWAGLRPMTPNSLPITKPIADGIIANTGHGALGWTYAAGSAEQVADLIDGKADGA